MGKGRIATLTQKQDFDRLFKAGKRYHDKLLMTVVRLRADDERPRAAFIVSTKVDKRAVVRNRIKRRMREVWRREMPALRDGVDVAFVTRAPAAQASYHDLAAVMSRHLRKAGLIG